MLNDPGQGQPHHGHRDVTGGWLPTERAAMAWVAAARDCATIGLAARLSIFGVGETSIFLMLDSTHYAELFIASGKLTAWLNTGTGESNQTPSWPGYSATNMQWLRFRESGGRLIPMILLQLCRSRPVLPRAQCPFNRDLPVPV